jgi:hypothetical protein
MIEMHGMRLVVTRRRIRDRWQSMGNRIRLQSVMCRRSVHRTDGIEVSAVGQIALW